MGTKEGWEVEGLSQWELGVQSPGAALDAGRPRTRAYSASQVTSGERGPEAQVQTSLLRGVFKSFCSALTLLNQPPA